MKDGQKTTEVKNSAAHQELTVFKFTHFWMWKFEKQKLIIFSFLHLATKEKMLLVGKSPLSTLNS